MGAITARDFGAPDETRSPDKALVEVLDLDSAKVARMTLQPGWRWSESVKPIVGTETCQVRHLGLALAGRIHVVHEDGTECDIHAGEAYVIEPGHDAWVVGDEPLVAYEFESDAAEHYAEEA
jgi:hypothetical protein